MSIEQPNKLTTSPAGVLFIKRREGLRLKVYKCTAGYLTIGRGHRLLKHEQHIKSITLEQAEAYFAQDLSVVEIYLNANVRVVLSQHQFDALVSFCFNLGVGAYDRSTLRLKINASDFKGAADEFLRWNKERDPKTGKYRVNKGLSNRRAEERALFNGVLHAI